MTRDGSEPDGDLGFLLARAASLGGRLQAENDYLRTRDRARWSGVIFGTDIDQVLEHAGAGVIDARVVWVEGEPPSDRERLAAALHFRVWGGTGLLVSGPASAAACDLALGGTLFLDDIETVAPSSQAEALRALSSGSKQGRLVLGSPTMIDEVIRAGRLHTDVAAPARRCVLRLSTAGEPPAKATLRERVEGYERQLLVEALRAHGGNKTRTADALGITREGLHKKLAKHRV